MGYIGMQKCITKAETNCFIPLVAIVNGIKSERFKYHECCPVIKLATAEKFMSNNKLAYGFICINKRSQK